MSKVSSLFLSSFQPAETSSILFLLKNNFLLHFRNRVFEIVFHVFLIAVFIVACWYKCGENDFILLFFCVSQFHDMSHFLQDMDCGYSCHLCYIYLSVHLVYIFELRNA